jgi:serine/threonine protein kinase
LSNDSSDGPQSGGSERKIEVVAQIGENLVSEERVHEAYQMLASATASHHKYFLRPIEMQHLPSLDDDHETSLMVCIYESPGPNDLLRFVDCGATRFHMRCEGDQSDEVGLHRSDRSELMSLQSFLDFAIGAAECIESLHSQRIVHGQIRGDAFHFSQETGQVRLIYLGLGLQFHDTGRLSGRWPALENQKGASANISNMSPEHTGRAPIQLDNWADIYDLGVLLWSALVNETPPGGKTFMETTREVLGQELPSISTLRPDVPNTIARIIAKAAAKNVSERYNSVRGLRHDLVEVRGLLAAGDMAEVEAWEIAGKDVSPFFTLPRMMVGRTTERDAIVEVLDRAFRMYQDSRGLHLLSLPEDQTARFTVSPLSGASLEEEEARELADGFSNLPLSTNITSAGIVQSYPANVSRARSSAGSQYSSNEGSESGRVDLDKEGVERRSSTLSFDSISGGGSSRSGENARRTAAHRAMVPKKRCEIINVEGGAGLGKSRLISSVQIAARRRGFFASSRFDIAVKDRQRPILNLFSSLFEQAFSENTIEPSFLPMLRNHIRPVWDTLHKILGLPKFLLGSGSNFPEQMPHNAARSTSSLPYRTPSENTGTESSQKFLRTGSSTKSLPLVRTLLDILRAFTQYKLVYLCLDDVHLADEESLEIIGQIVSARIEMVVILAYRPENASSDMMTKLLRLSTNKGILLFFSCLSGHLTMMHEAYQSRTSERKRCRYYQYHTLSTERRQRATIFSKHLVFARPCSLASGGALSI